jgi:CMP-2-keto-3-deoxyoctulosonic acid synthetase
MEIIVNIQGEDDFEAKYSIDQLVQLVQEGQEVVDSNIANDYMDEDSTVIFLPS